MGRLCLLILVALLAAAGCGRPVQGPASTGGRVIIFVLDSPIDPNFVEGREATRPASQVSHGSLVGRVVRRYCDAELVSIPVEGLGGGISHPAYLGGLRQVLDYAAGHPQRRMIANISLGSGAADPVEEGLIRQLIAAGVLVVAAAGNDASERPDYPAGYPGVVAVAAATAEGKAPSSNYGAYVSIAASGDITFIDYEFLPYEQLRREMDARGTSFASPRVAAAVAWVIARRPALSVQDAYRIVRATAQPIEDDYFRRGLLGSGLLDTSRLRTLASPGFLFLHYVLPVIVWVLLGILSVWLCLRHGFPGLFLTLILWLVALPVSVLFVVESVAYLEFVGGGSIGTGVAAAGVLALGAAAAAPVQRWNVAKTALALLAPYSAFAVLPVAGGGVLVGPVGAALAAAVLGLAASAALEARTRRKISRLRAGSVEGGMERLLRAYHWSLDARVKEAVVAAAGRVDDPAAADFLLREGAFPRVAQDALAALARRDPELLRDLLERFDALRRPERRRLSAALVQAENPGIIPLLEEVYRQRPSPGAERLLRALRELAGGSAPDAQ